MRTQHELALALFKLGMEAAAVEHLLAMLKLNPIDNQSIWYLLFGILRSCDEILALKTLLADYVNQWSSYRLYGCVLIDYREVHVAAATSLHLLNEANSANAHVPAILAGTKAAALSTSSYANAGCANEATDQVRERGAVWRKTLASSNGSQSRSPRLPKRGVVSAKHPGERPYRHF